MASGSRGAKLAKALEGLAKVHGKEPARNPGSEPLDHLVYGIIAGTSPASKAREAYQALGEAFVDRNELRVAATEEIVEHLGALDDEPAARARADLLRRTLQALFDSLDKVRMVMDTDDSAARIARILGSVPGLPQGLVAAILARARPEPPVRPIPSLLRAAQRLGLVDKGSEAKQVAALAAAAANDEMRILLHWILVEHGDACCLAPGSKCDECHPAAACDGAKKKAAK